MKMAISTRMKVLLIIVLVHACLSGCPSGQYSDNNKRCNKCHSSCGECSGPSENSCLSCSGSKIFQESKKCCVDSCPDGSFKDMSRGKAVCTKGHSSCKTCNGPTEKNCQSCEGPNNFLTSDSRCVAVCPSDCFKNTNGQLCTKCHSSCGSCSGPSENSCLSCSGSKIFQESKKCCVDSCPDGSFKDMSRGKAICTVGHPSCKTCSGPKETDCLTCPIGKYYHEANHSCCSVCPASYVPMADWKCGKCGDGTYYDSSSKKCQPCKSSCKTCDGPKETDCKSCRASKVLYQDRCIDNCPDGLYESGNTCLPCQAPCENCKKSATNCTSCKKWYKLVQNTCVFDCPDGYFKDMSRGSAICSVGHPSCKTCSGPKDSDCLSCRGSQMLYKGRCYDNCPDGCFKDISRGNAICSVGHPSCKTCSGPKDSDCLSCRGSQMLYKGRCSDNCPDGLFLDNSRKMCSECHSNCAKCRDSSVNCQSCNSGCYLTGNSCVTKCPLGQRGDNSKRQCMKLLRNLDAPDGEDAP